MSKAAVDENPYSAFQLFSLVALRMLIGWHFLYEGIAKFINPYWTSAGYLQASQGPFADWFVSLAVDPGRLAIVDGVVLRRRATRSRERALGPVRPAPVRASL